MMVGKLTRKRRAKCQFYAALCYFEEKDYVHAEESLTVLVDKFTMQTNILDADYQVQAHELRGQAHQ
jgi:hypothetical protein